MWLYGGGECTQGFRRLRLSPWLSGLNGGTEYASWTDSTWPSSLLDLDEKVWEFLELFLPQSPGM